MDHHPFDERYYKETIKVENIDMRLFVAEHGKESTLAWTIDFAGKIFGEFFIVEEKDLQDDDLREVMREHAVRTFEQLNTDGRN